MTTKRTKSTIRTILCRNCKERVCSNCRINRAEFGIFEGESLTQLCRPCFAEELVEAVTNADYTQLTSLSSDDVGADELDCYQVNTSVTHRG